MLRAILNKSWQQHLTDHQQYNHLPPITKTIQVRRTRHAGYCWRSRDKLINDVLLWTPTYDQAKAGRLARTYSGYVRIRDVALKTCRRRWTIGRSGERGSKISMQAAQHDHDDLWFSLVVFYDISSLVGYFIPNPIYIYIYIYIYICIHIYIYIYNIVNSLVVTLF